MAEDINGRKLQEGQTVVDLGDVQEKQVTVIKISTSTHSDVERVLLSSGKTYDYEHGFRVPVARV